MGAKVEAVLSLTGGFGQWHWTVVILAALPGISFISSRLGMMFVAVVPDHWCLIPQLKEANWSVSDIKKAAIPMDMQRGEGVYSQCYMYQRNYTALVDLGPNDTNWEPPDEIQTIGCRQWEFDHSVFKSSIVSDWELVCERLPILATIHSAFSIGLLISSIFSGPLSDKYGRRTCAVVGTVVMVVVSVVNIFSVNYVMMTAVRLVIGYCTFCIYSCCFALVAELCPDEKRASVMFLFDFFPGCGRWIAAAVAYFIRDWRYLLLAYCLPIFTFLSFYWYLPESPRWLLVKGRTTEAGNVITRAAKGNKMPAPDADVLHRLLEASKEEQEEDKKASFSGMMRSVTAFVKTKEMRRRSIPMFFCWFVIAFVSYGLLFHFSTLPLNLYLLHVINGVVVSLTRAFIVVWPLPDYLGRKTCFLGCLVLGGLSGLLILAVPEDMEWLLVTLSLACSGFVSETFSLVYLYTAEMFPTEVRNTSISVGSVFARCGGISAPFIANYLYTFHYSIPSAMFGGFSALAAAACCLLPETYGKHMPETIAELEASCDKANKDTCNGNQK